MEDGEAGAYSAARAVMANCAKAGGALTEHLSS